MHAGGDGAASYIKSRAHSAIAAAAWGRRRPTFGTVCWVALRGRQIAPAEERRGSIYDEPSLKMRRQGRCSGNRAVEKLGRRIGRQMAYAYWARGSLSGSSGGVDSYCRCRLFAMYSTARRRAYDRK